MKVKNPRVIYPPSRMLDEAERERERERVKCEIDNITIANWRREMRKGFCNGERERKRRERLHTAL